MRKFPFFIALDKRDRSGVLHLFPDKAITLSIELTNYTTHYRNVLMKV